MDIIEDCAYPTNMPTGAATCYTSDVLHRFIWNKHGETNGKWLMRFGIFLFPRTEEQQLAFHVHPRGYTPTPTPTPTHTHTPKSRWIGRWEKGWGQHEISTPALRALSNLWPDPTQQTKNLSEIGQSTGIWTPTSSLNTLNPQASARPLLPIKTQ